MYLLNLIIICSIIPIYCENSKKFLSRFQTDVDKVGRDFENLIFGVVKKIVQDVNVYQSNYDYSASEEDSLQSPKVTTQHSITKKVLDNVIENSTQDYTTERNSGVENTVYHGDFLQNRVRRSADNVSIDDSTTNDTKFCIKNPEEAALEQQHIDDLKEEIKKLHDLVLLLRDQQRILSLLDKNMQNLDVNMSTKFDAKSLLKMLDYVNDKNIEEKDKKSNEKSEEKMTVHEELAKMKNDLREAVTALNRTREALVKESKKELLLERELNDQKLDINFLKMLIGKLYKNGIGSHEEDMENRALGVAIPKNAVEDSVPVATSTENENENTVGDRAADLDDLERIISNLDTPSTNDIQTKLFQLQQDLDKKKQDAEKEKQLRNLIQYLERRTLNPSAKSESELDMIRRLLALKTMDKPKGRDLDVSIEEQLQQLQDAIDNLKPKDEQDITKPEKSDDQTKSFQSMLDQLKNQSEKKDECHGKQMQLMLEKVLNENKMKEVKSEIGIQQNKMLLKEIMELRKELAEVKKFRSEDGDQFAENGDVSENKGISGGKPNQFHSLNPEKKVPGPYNRYYPSSSDYIPQKQNNNFLPTYSYFKSIPHPHKKVGEEDLNYPPRKIIGTPDWYNIDNIKPTPDQYNFGPALDHDFYKIPPEHTKNFKPPSAPYQTTGPDAENQNNQHFFQPDVRNEFFPAPYTKPVQEPWPGPSGGGASQPGPYTQKGLENEFVSRRMEDLRSQIYDLQSIIDGLTKSSHTQTSEEKETVLSLEKQINGLKGQLNGASPVAYSLTYGSNHPNVDPSHFPSVHPGIFRRRRSVDNEVGVEADAKLYDRVASGLKELIFQKRNVAEVKSNYDDIQKKIDDIKYQLEAKTLGEHHFNTVFPNLAPQSSHFQSLPPKFELSKSKNNDIFTSIILNILDKVLGATPAILEKLFGKGLAELSNFGEYSEYNVNYGGQSDIQKLFRNLGYFGYFPLIFLKLIDGFTTFVKILRKNDFFKNFLMPALVLLLVAGAIIFLVWWLQSDPEYHSYNYYDPNFKPNGNYYTNYHKYNEPYSNYNYPSNAYGTYDNNYNYGRSYRPAEYL